MNRRLGINRGSVGRQSRGFGDTVAKAINRHTNIKPKEGCGCKKKQEMLNKMFPYKRR
jgi:hypothetical protein